MWINLKNYFFPPSSPVRIVEYLYRKIDGGYVSKAERNRLGINDTSFVYGEVKPESFLEILKLTNPQTNDIFYDLGSGTGIAVFTAALQYHWGKCIGIELLPGLNFVSEELLKKLFSWKIIQSQFLAKVKAISFIKDNFLNVDFTDGDVIFVNATTLNAVLWGELGLKLREIKAGARVITTTRKLDLDAFELLHEGIYEMSWGDCSVFVYRRL